MTPGALHGLITTIPIEISARHVHLSVTDWRRLFPTDQPTAARAISQRPQFVAAERVMIDGPHGSLASVAIVGPLRPYTQLELAASDARTLGLTAPLRDSGQLEGAAEVTIHGPAGAVAVRAAVIQRRHIHASPAEAQQAGLHDGQLIRVQVDGPRGGTFDNVLVRVRKDYSWSMHIDTDEANAFGLAPGQTGQVLP